VSGDELGWTDIATDGAGRLFALSVVQTESEFEPYLYELNPSTGSVTATVGAAGDGSGDSRFSDFDHDGDMFYGSGAVEAQLCCGQLFSMDSTAQETWISSDTLGYGLNPYDTTGSADPIARGGFAIHPTTGDFWGIEALQSQATVLYRIDPGTGLADSVMKVGPPEFGYDGLHILDDGTFVAVRGGPFANDSVLWEIDPTPDSLGVVPIQLIPLTFDTLIVGNLNGLEEIVSAQDPLVLSLTADTTALHPWIRSDTVVIADGDTLRQVEKEGDTTTVVLTATAGSAPAAGTEVILTAHFLPGTGGHVHLTDTLEFSYAPFLAYGAGGSKPVTGYFKQGSLRTDSLTDTSDVNGEVSFAFVAGFIGGSIELVAEAFDGGAPIADTLALTIRVPGLTDLQANSTANANAYFIGGTPFPQTTPPDTIHPQDSIWYVTPQFANSVTAIIDEMDNDSTDTHLQINDASLPLGGSFSITPIATENGLSSDRPYNGANMGHGTHALGLDVDVAACFNTETGMDLDQQNRDQCVGTGTVWVPETYFEVVVHSFGLKVLREGDHFHVFTNEGR
jgi:hypothetical protein